MQDQPNFNSRLDDLMSEFGKLNPSELAELINRRFPDSAVARTTPHKWLTSTPGWDYILKIADVFEVSTDWLGGRIGADRDSPHARQVFQQLFLNLSDLPDTASLTPTERLAKAIQCLQAIDHRSVGSDWMVSNRMGISIHTLHSILDGTLKLHEDTLFRTFGEFTGVPLQWMLDGDHKTLKTKINDRDFLSFFFEMRAAGVTGADLAANVYYFIQTIRHFVRRK